MPRLLLALLVLPLFLVAGCGSGDDGDDQTAEGDEKTATPVAARSTPTTAELLELAKLAVPGFSAAEASPSLVGANATYTSEKQTAGGANIVVRVSLVPCDAFICGSLDPKDYQAADTQRNLKSILPTAHIENPDLRWEFGAFKFSNSATGLFHYALSYLEEKHADGSVTRSSANSFRAWYHNDTILIAFDVFGRSSNPVLSVADLEKRMPKAEAEQAARDIFAVYGPKLPK